jgi:hypothetical protein
MRTKTMLIASLVAAAFAGGALAGPKDIEMHQLKDLKWTPISPAGDKGPQVSFVYGDDKTKGPVAFYLKLPAGLKPGPHTHTSDYCAVVIQGTMHDWKTPGTDEGPAVGPGGSWCQPGGQPHDNECEASSKDGCINFITMPKGFDFKPVVDKKAPAGKEPAKK